jgi:hypothetical protein
MPAFVLIDTLSTVMAGLVPAIHVFGFRSWLKTWMPATSAGMTSQQFRFRASDTR